MFIDQAITSYRDYKDLRTASVHVGSDIAVQQKAEPPNLDKANCKFNKILFSERANCKFNEILFSER